MGGRGSAGGTRSTYRGSSTADFRRQGLNGNGQPLPDTGSGGGSGGGGGGTATSGTGSTSTGSIQTGGGNGNGGGSAPATAPTVTPEPVNPVQGNTYKRVAVGKDANGNPIDDQGRRVPVSVTDDSPNTHPGSGYAQRGEDGKSTNVSQLGERRLADGAWIPEVGANDPVLRSAQTIQQIVDHMNSKYASRNWDFSSLSAPDFGANKMDIETAREAAQAFDDIVTKFPQIEFSDPKPLQAQGNRAYAFARALGATATTTDDGYVTKTYTGSQFVAVSLPSATTEARNELFILHRDGKRDSETRDYNLDAMNRPTYYTMVHEMTHVLDMNGGGNAHPRVLEYINNAWEESPEADRLYNRLIDQLGESAGLREFNRAKPALVKAWLKNRLVSAYSYSGSNRDQGMYIVEAIAEAGLDVHIRGDKANEFSKAIYQIVVEEFNKAKGIS